MAHGDARAGKWRGNWRMEWVASTLHTTSEHAISSITTADAHTSAASSRLNWRPSRFKWTRPFRRKTKSGFCACAITLQLASSTTSRCQHCRPKISNWLLLFFLACLFFFNPSPSLFPSTCCSSHPSLSFPLCPPLRYSQPSLFHPPILTFITYSSALFLPLFLCASQFLLSTFHSSAHPFLLLPPLSLHPLPHIIWSTTEIMRA